MCVKCVMHNDNSNESLKILQMEDIIKIHLNNLGKIFKRLRKFSILSSNIE